VSRICADLDAEVGAFRDRDLSALGYPYVVLDATYCKARVNHRVVSQAIVVAFGVAADGRREVLGFDVGDSENEAFWTEFLRSLKTRGLGGVKPVISDAHTGLKKAINTVFQGASWQRCRVHFMRNVLSIVPKGAQEMVASIIRTVFAQPDAGHVNTQFDEVARMLGKSHPKVARMLHDAREDVLAFCGFPPKPWRQVWSTNPMVIFSPPGRVFDVQQGRSGRCDRRGGHGYLRCIHYGTCWRANVGAEGDHPGVAGRVVDGAWRR
jgi:putative transposase